MNKSDGDEQKKVVRKNRGTPSVAAPDDTHPNDAMVGGSDVHQIRKWQAKHLHFQHGIQSLDLSNMNM